VRAVGLFFLRERGKGRGRRDQLGAAGDERLCSEKEKGRGRKERAGAVLVTRSLFFFSKRKRREGTKGGTRDALETSASTSYSSSCHGKKEKGKKKGRGPNCRALSLTKKKERKNSFSYPFWKKKFVVDIDGRRILTSHSLLSKEKGKKGEKKKNR